MPSLPAQRRPPREPAPAEPNNDWAGLYLIQETGLIVHIVRSGERPCHRTVGKPWIPVSIPTVLVYRRKMGYCSHCWPNIRAFEAFIGVPLNKQTVAH